MAFLNSADRYHKEAIAIWRTLLEQDESLVTNNYILVETIALLQHRFGFDATRKLQENVIPLISIHWVDKTLHEQTMAALMTAYRRRLSLVDCSAMLTMRALGINQIFTFDPHFTDYGFSPLSQ